MTDLRASNEITGATAAELAAKIASGDLSSVEVTQAHLDRIADLGVPVLAGMSRKAMLGALTGRDVREREFAGVAAHLVAVVRGARILRVHDVAAMKDALTT